MLKTNLLGNISISSMMPSHSNTSSMEPENGSVMDAASQSRFRLPIDPSRPQSSSGGVSHTPGTRRHGEHYRSREQHRSGQRQADHAHRSRHHPLCNHSRPSTRSHRVAQPRQVLQQPAYPQLAQPQPVHPQPLTLPWRDYYLHSPPNYAPVTYADQVILEDEYLEPLPITVNGPYACAPDFVQGQPLQNGVARDLTLRPITQVWYEGRTPEERLRLGLPRWITSQQQAEYEEAAAVYEYVDQNF